jgi:hypothetical protein
MRNDDEVVPLTSLGHGQQLLAPALLAGLCLRIHRSRTHARLALLLYNKTFRPVTWRNASMAVIPTRRAAAAARRRTALLLLLTGLLPAALLLVSTLLANARRGRPHLAALAALQASL